MNQPHIPLYIEKYDAINSSSPDITTMKRKGAMEEEEEDERHRIFPMREIS
jgi:hypothetical protein